MSLGYLSRLGAAIKTEPARGASPGDRLVESRSATIPGLIEALSERELEVLHLLAAGKANREIADELFITLDTVKKHTTHILGKLGATNRTEAGSPAPETSGWSTSPRGNSTSRVHLRVMTLRHPARTVVTS